MNCWYLLCRYLVVFVLWALLFFMIYKVLTLEKDYIEYDPFEILQLDPVSVSRMARARVIRSWCWLTG